VVGKKGQLDNPREWDEPLSTSNYHPEHSGKLISRNLKGGLLSAKSFMMGGVGNGHRYGRVQTTTAATCAGRNG
jgi:hypothetical protein